MSARADTARLGERLQYVTMLWNSAECVVAVAAGVVAGSIALVGFGFDSAIEVTSSVAAVWRLRADRDEAAREAAERRTLTIVGVCFLTLAAYVAYDAARDLLAAQPPARSLPGIIVAALSLIVMPLLVRAKRRVAARLRSSALEAEARQTRVCAWLSAILLLGLAANAAFGWWWADPAAALAMVPLIAWEGWQALTGTTGCAD